MSWGYSETKTLTASMGFSAMGERLQDTQPLRGHGLQWGSGSSSLTDELAVLQAETKKRMSGM